MAFNDVEKKRVEHAVEAFIERRQPPAHLRRKLDLGFRISGQSVELFEIRPRWDRPSEAMETPVAKATYVRTREVWKVFWMRRDLKWHGYDPAPTVGSIERFLALVDEDRYACFFG